MWRMRVASLIPIIIVLTRRGFSGRRGRSPYAFAHPAVIALDGGSLNSKRTPTRISVRGRGIVVCVDVQLHLQLEPGMVATCRAPPPGVAPSHSLHSHSAPGRLNVYGIVEQ